MGARVTRQSLRQDYIDKMFNGNTKEFTEWSHHSAIEGLDMTFEDILLCPSSWDVLQAYLCGYLKGKQK